MAYRRQLAVLAIVAAYMVPTLSACSRQSYEQAVAKAIMEKHYEVAERIVQNAIKHLEKDQPNSKTLASCWNDLGTVCRYQRRLADAEEAYKKSLEIDKNTMPPGDPQIASDCTDLANVYYSENKFAEAEPLYVRALESADKFPTSDDTTLAKYCDNLARIYSSTGNAVKEEPLRKRILTIREKQQDPDASELATALFLLAQLHARQGRDNEAQPLYERAVSLDDKVKQQLILALNQISLATLQQKHHAGDQAKLLAKCAETTLEKYSGADYDTESLCLNNLGALYGTMGNYNQAEQLFKRAVASDEKYLGPDNARVAIGLDNVVGAYCHEGKYLDAEPLCKRAISILERYPSRSPDLADCLKQYGGLLRELGRRKEAEEIMHRYDGIKQKPAAVDPG